MTLTEIRDITTTVIAVLAFGLSIFNFYVNRRDKRPRLNITDTEAKILPVKFVSDGAGGYLSVDAPGITIRLQNIGEKDIRLESVFLCTRTRFLRLYCTKLGYANLYAPIGSIEAGVSRTLIFSISDTLQIKKGRMYIQVIDEIGNRYKSKRFWVHLDKLKVDTP